MFKKFKTMSKEKKINIEDGNAKEQVLNENAEQNDTQNNEEPKAEETNTEDGLRVVNPTGNVTPHSSFIEEPPITELPSSTTSEELNEKND